LNHICLNDCGCNGLDLTGNKGDLATSTAMLHVAALQILSRKAELAIAEAMTNLFLPPIRHPIQDGLSGNLPSAKLDAGQPKKTKVKMTFVSSTRSRFKFCH